MTTNIQRNIILNGKKQTMFRGQLSYAEIAALVGIQQPTITYRDATGSGGILSQGQRLMLWDGLIIDTANTSAA